MKLFQLIYGVLKQKIIFLSLWLRWRKRNSHNSTSISNMFDISAVEVGVNTYGGLCVMNSSPDKDIKLRIGNYCSIAKGVTFILAGDHNTGTLSTFPFINRLIDPTYKEARSKGNIIIQDDVWIGINSTILSGVTIGQGAVVASHSLVSKDVPPYAIVGGVPAKVIKYRFSEGIVKELLKVDYGKLTKEMIEQHTEELYEELTDVGQLDWLPRRN